MLEYDGIDISERIDVTRQMYGTPLGTLLLSFYFYKTLYEI